MTDTTLPGVLLHGVAASRPSASAVAKGTLYSATDTGAITQSDGVSTWTAYATITAGFANPMTTSGDIIYGASSGTPTRLAKGSDTQVLTLASGLPSWASPGGGGGSISTVDQDISADFTTSNDSAWHNITGLTGISLTAGTWIGMFDIEPEPPSITSIGPAFRIWDGTTTYAQAGYLVTSPVGAISSHQFLASKPFVLGGSATMACAVFSDTAFTIKKYPTRGGLSSAVATHVTFIKIA